MPCSSGWCRTLAVSLSTSFNGSLNFLVVSPLSAAVCGLSLVMEKFLAMHEVAPAPASFVGSCHGNIGESADNSCVLDTDAN